MRTSWIAALILLAAVAIVASPADRASCENLSKLTIPNTTITRSQIYPAGPLAPPPDNGIAPPKDPEVSDLPAFCLVQATLTPSTDSDIKIDVGGPQRTRKLPSAGEISGYSQSRAGSLRCAGWIKGRPHPGSDALPLRSEGSAMRG